jgi:hypothetical protein
MRLDLDSDQLRQCTSKVRHDSAAKAYKVMKRSPYRKVLDVYKCRYCDHWHIGHKTTHVKG